MRLALIGLALHFASPWRTDRSSLARAVGLQTIGVAAAVGTVAATTWYVLARQRHAKWQLVARVRRFKAAALLPGLR